MKYVGSETGKFNCGTGLVAGLKSKVCYLADYISQHSMATVEKSRRILEQFDEIKKDLELLHKELK